MVQRYKGFFVGRDGFLDGITSPFENNNSSEVDIFGHVFGYFGIF